MGNLACAMKCHGNREEKKKPKRHQSCRELNRNGFVGSWKKNPQLVEQQQQQQQHAEKGIVRVKVILTKAEVERLLSMGVNSTEKMIQHLANEVGRSSFGTASWKPALQSIPEVA